MHIQALRALEVSPDEAAGSSVPRISSVGIASSADSVAESSSPTGGRLFFGASVLFDKFLLGRDSGDVAAIAVLMCVCKSHRYSMNLKADWDGFRCHS